MDQVKMQNTQMTDVATDLLIAELPLSTRRDSKLTVLDEWEMALAGGGEGMPCW